MPLGLEVGLSPGHIVLDGDPDPPSPPKKRGTAVPLFSAHVCCGQNGRPSQLLLRTCYAKKCVVGASKLSTRGSSVSENSHLYHGFKEQLNR